MKIKFLSWCLYNEIFIKPNCACVYNRVKARIQMKSDPRDKVSLLLSSILLYYINACINNVKMSHTNSRRDRERERHAACTNNLWWIDKWPKTVGINNHTNFIMSPTTEFVVVRSLRWHYKLFDFQLKVCWGLCGTILILAKSLLCWRIIRFDF